MDINTSPDKPNFKKRRNKRHRNNSNAAVQTPPQAEKPVVQNVQNVQKNKNFKYNKNKKELPENNINHNHTSGEIPETADITVPETGNIIPEPAEKIETGPMVEIVGIRYKPVGKIYFFAPNDMIYSVNDKVIVETSKGIELGYVVISNKNISESKVVQPLKPVLRKATDEDTERAERNRKLAKETIKTANEKIKFYNLDSMKMKLVEAEYTFDNSKLTYYFTADGRVDFRELVKDLAAIFKTRIEMRQIGIRDQTKILGGLSICGRAFCCNSFLQDFAQVTIKMAKEQNMSINSAKISGACGRLMCCLKYEHEAYDYLSKDTPKVHSIVEISSGETGTVIESNLLTGICKVRVTQKNNGDSDNIIKLLPKKSLKVIGFMKNEQSHLYGGEDKEDKGEQEF